jgi:hypothetical protein
MIGGASRHVTNSAFCPRDNDKLGTDPLRLREFETHALVNLLLQERVLAGPGGHGIGQGFYFGLGGQYRLGTIDGMIYFQLIHNFRQGLLVRFRLLLLKGAQRTTAKGPAPGKGVPALTRQKAAASVLARGGHGVQVTTIFALLLHHTVVVVERHQGRGYFVQDHRVLLGTGVGGMQIRVLRGNGQTNHGRWLLGGCHTVVIRERDRHDAQSGEDDRALHVFLM